MIAFDVDPTGSAETAAQEGQLSAALFGISRAVNSLGMASSPIRKDKLIESPFGPGCKR